MPKPDYLIWVRSVCEIPMEVMMRVGMSAQFWILVMLHERLYRMIHLFEQAACFRKGSMLVMGEVSEKGNKR